MATPVRELVVNSDCTPRLLTFPNDAVHDDVLKKRDEFPELIFNTCKKFCVILLVALVSAVINAFEPLRIIALGICIELVFTPFIPDEIKIELRVNESETRLVFPKLRELVFVM